MNFKKFINNEKENKGILIDIEKDTIENNNFRKVIWTGKELQLVLMSLKANEEIGIEKHNNDQFFRVDKGFGFFILEDKKYLIKDGSAFTVLSGTKHNIIAGKEGLKLYTIYAPPHHKNKKIEKEKPNEI